MTASGRYASPDSSFGRSTGNAAARGGALIAVAVVIGFLLLWQGGVGGSDDAVTATPNASDDAVASDDATDAEGDVAVEGATEDPGTEDPGTDDGTGDPAVDPGTTDTTTTTVAAAVTTRPPGEVRAAVANATETSGLAGARSGELATAGYVTAAVNAFNDTAVSNVYYVEGYGPEAEQVAIVLGGSAAVLRPATQDEISGLVAEANRADVDGFHILVVVGTDGVLG